LVEVKDYDLVQEKDCVFWVEEEEKE